MGTPSGLVTEANVGARIDYYKINDDPLVESEIRRVVPQATLILRYPLLKTSNRAVHVLEPVIAIGWSDVLGGLPPNEDSTRAELDHGNLIALTRTAADDATETGWRGAIGVNWTRSGFEGSKTN